jgi:hypothetical protein
LWAIWASVLEHKLILFLDKASIHFGGVKKGKAVPLHAMEALGGEEA